MRNPGIPSLLTPGRLADELGAPLLRGAHVLATRRHITPAACARTLRLYHRNAVAPCRHELNAIDAQRDSRRPGKKAGR